MKKCVFAGTFDPPTTGHESVIDRCLAIFDKVVVGVMDNPSKSPHLAAAERKYLLELLYRDEPRVEIRIFGGAAADLLDAESTPFYVRGVRDGLDLDYENRDYFATKRIKKDVIVIYLPADQDKTHVSSTLVRNCQRYGKDYKEYIPKSIESEYARILKERRDV